MYEEIMKSKLITELSGGLRHSYVRFCVLAQFLYQVARQPRKAFLQVHACGFFDEKQINELHSEYANTIPKRNFMYQLLTATENKGCCVIDKTRQECFKITMPPVKYDPKKFPFPYDRMQFGNCWQRIISEERYISINSQCEAIRSKQPAEADVETQEKTFIDPKGTVVVRTKK
jgi:hypothetical protein